MVKMIFDFHKFILKINFMGICMRLGRKNGKWAYVFLSMDTAMKPFVCHEKCAQRLKWVYKGTAWGEHAAGVLFDVVKML